MTVSINKKLKLQEIKSQNTAVKITDSADLQEAVKNYLGNEGIITVWQIHSVVWGKISNGNIKLADNTTLNLALCQEIRIFNETAELHIIRSGKKLTGRAIVDGAGETVPVVDSIAPMWGKSAGNSAGYTELTDEARKIYLDVPAEIAAGKRCGLITRNYITVDEETGLSGYGDYRFMGLQELEV